MSDYIVAEKNKRTFQDLVFDHLSRILEMTKYEMTGGYYNTTYSGSLSTKTYVSDKKEEYCQLVEALSDILLPHFDKQMILAYGDYEKKLEEAQLKYHNANGEPIDNEHYRIFSRIRLRLTRKLFRELNLLLGPSRLDYLKGRQFGQSDLDELEEEEVIDT